MIRPGRPSFSIDCERWQDEDSSEEDEKKSKPIAKSLHYYYHGNVGRWAQIDWAQLKNGIRNSIVLPDNDDQNGEVIEDFVDFIDVD